MASNNLEVNTEKRRVLSIQSHVVHGYVGNKSATFPLQVLGFDVDAINSVQFSNHTGYQIIKGQVLKENDLGSFLFLFSAREKFYNLFHLKVALFEGLEKNNLLTEYSHLLTGYIGNVSFLREIAKIVKKMRKINPNLIYVCDPVMGDNEKMYVPLELLPIYRDEIIPLADIITPNQYEVELLTGNKINNDLDAWNAMKWFHSKNINTVVLSSTELGPPEELLAFLSQKNGQNYSINIPKQGYDLNISFTGTGDLFAALYLAHSYKNINSGKAFEYTIATLQAVIKRTINEMPKQILSGQRIVTSKERELKLINSKNDIENPTVHLKAILIEN